MENYHGLEELTLLKCPYHPKQATDLIQPTLKFQWHFNIKEQKIPKFV